ncbi:transposase [Streptomyces sp. MUSC 14]|uniref:transposase n=1 Tax=Streptomyces sp. MUSC 14 TaxID=1354889 RepID=UPI00352833E1
MHRFPCADRLCSWAGLTPRHYESDTVVRRGHVTKQGSKLVRWAVVEAIRRATTSKIAEDRARIEARRGRNIAKVAAARKLLRWSPTGCATDTSAPWPARRREQPGWRQARGRAIVWPPQRRGRGFDWPCLPHVVSLHAAQRREGMTGSRVRPCPPASRTGEQRHPQPHAHTYPGTTPRPRVGQPCPIPPTTSKNTNVDRTRPFRNDNYSISIRTTPDVSWISSATDPFGRIRCTDFVPDQWGARCSRQDGRHGPLGVRVLGLPRLRGLPADRG